MKKYIYKTFFFASVVSLLISCEVREFSDLNNAETDAFNDNLVFRNEASFVSEEI